MSGRIIALVGPSGVGKNYAKQAIKNSNPQLVELSVLTTRPRRTSDGVDRATDIPQDQFLRRMSNGEIVGGHQPFGSDTDWYGFSKQEIDSLLGNSSSILTELHVDNVELFHRLYTGHLLTIGLTAERKYLENNLYQRGSESDEDKEKRLNTALNEIRQIQDLNSRGYIDEVVNVDMENRENFGELIVDKVRELSLNKNEGEKINLR